MLSLRVIEEAPSSARSSSAIGIFETPYKASVTSLLRNDWLVRENYSKLSSD